jgi:hypothetical protein
MTMRIGAARCFEAGQSQPALLRPTRTQSPDGSGGGIGAVAYEWMVALEGWWHWSVVSVQNDTFFFKGRLNKCKHVKHLQNSNDLSSLVQKLGKKRKRAKEHQNLSYF